MMLKSYLWTVSASLKSFGDFRDEQPRVLRHINVGNQEDFNWTLSDLRGEIYPLSVADADALIHPRQIERLVTARVAEVLTT